MFCKNCGSTIEENFRFCKNCGQKVEINQNNEAIKADAPIKINKKPLNNSLNESFKYADPKPAFKLSTNQKVAIGLIVFLVVSIYFILSNPSKNTPSPSKSSSSSSAQSSTAPITTVKNFFSLMNSRDVKSACKLTLRGKELEKDSTKFSSYVSAVSQGLNSKGYIIKLGSISEVSKTDDKCVLDVYMDVMVNDGSTTTTVESGSEKITLVKIDGKWYMDYTL